MADSLKVGWKKYFGDLFGEFATTTTKISANYDYHDRTTEMPMMTTNNGSTDYDYYLSNSTYNSTLARINCDSAFRYYREIHRDCVLTILSVFLIVAALFFVFGPAIGYAIKRLILHMKRKDYEECVMMGHIPSVKVVGIKCSEDTPVAYCKKISANELTSQEFHNFLYESI